MPPRATRAGAEVHALDARRVHEQLEHRSRQRKVGHERRIELQHDARTRPAVVVGLEPVRAQRREHEVQQRAEDAVFVEARDRVERGGDLVDERMPGLVAALASGAAPVLAGSRRALEQLDQLARDLGCAASVVAM